MKEANISNVLGILKKYRMLIIFVSCIVGYRLFFSSLITRYQDTKREIKVLEKKLSKAIPLLSEEEKVNSIYDALAEIMPVQVASDKIDWDKMSNEVYRTLSTIANKYNVKILNYRPRLEQLKRIKTETQDSLSQEDQKGKARPSAKTEAVRAMDMDLNLEAALPDFVRFVYYLENSVQLMEVDEAVLTAGSKKVLSIKLRIKKIIF